MSALHTLQNLLPVQELTVEAEPDSLQNLEAYTAARAPINLLTQLRINALRASENDAHHINSLTPTDIAKLTSKFTTYQKDIKGYRAKLEPIEHVLANLNSELVLLSSTLASLQQQLSKLLTDLDSLRLLTEKLNPVVLDLMIPPEIVRSVALDPITPEWVENIRYLNDKATHNETYKDTAAYSQLCDGLKLLRAKAIERIRDHLIVQIKSLRSSSKSSSQKIQQNLLQVKEVFVFLREHHPELANQLELAYIYTMRWYYHTRFAKYLYSLEKLHLRHIDSSFVLGGNESDDKSLGTGLKSWLGQSSLSPVPQPAHHKITLSDYFLSIDKRVQILDAPSEPVPAIPSQIAETTPFHYWLEFSFNQWLVAVVDNIVVEYLFMVEFFHQGDEKFDDISTLGSLSLHTDNEPQPSSGKNDWPTVMFGRVYQLGHEFVQWLITHQTTRMVTRIASGTTSRQAHSATGTCDAYAVLLMIRLIQNTQAKLHNEAHIPVLDDHLNSLLLVLWPHFTKIIDFNCELLKKSIMRPLANTNHVAPVAVTQHFAHYLLGLLRLSFSLDKNNAQLRGEPLFTSISRLRNDFESVLTKLGNYLFGKSPANKEIFLYNNYFLVVSILRGDHPDTNEFIDEQVNHFQMLCDAYNPSK